MDTPSVTARVLPTPFVASWFGRARRAELKDPDQGKRATAWAQWALESFSDMTGHSDRTYLAMVLPGQFYDPKGNGPQVRPHLEVPAWVLDRADPLFPDRLAQAGNALLFPWWVVPEVVAARRALFATPRGDVSNLVEALGARHGSLVTAVRTLLSSLSDIWTEFEAALVAEPQLVSAYLTDGFDASEVASFFPPAKGLDLRVVFDEKLATSSGGWASRRVGVWTLQGSVSGEKFTLGVLTPRLTRSSLFSDPLFEPSGESSAALLVRGLVYRRLLGTQVGASKAPAVVVADPVSPVKGGPHLKAVVARVGDRMPEASVAAAVHFVQAYPDPAVAWELLRTWAETRPAGESVHRATLTVTEEGFKSAHRAASRAVRRAETPERDDINVLLPLAWDSRNRVVRVTFSRLSDNDA